MYITIDNSKAPKFLNFHKPCLLKSCTKKYLQILHKLAYVHLLSEMRKKNHYVLSLYFGYKSNKHKNLMLCAFQNLELAKKEAALILRIFPFPASLDRSVFSCKLGSIQNLVKF